MDSSRPPAKRQLQLAVPDLPIEQVSFSGYRLPRPGAQDSGVRGASAVFLSLAHYFEAEKFRPFERELFEEMLTQPTVKEARKLAKRHEGQWRADWRAVRVRVLACGMVYAMRADSGGLRWLGTPETVAQMLQPLGLPESFLLKAATEFVRLRDAPRVAFLGASQAPAAVVGRRVNTVHKRAGDAWRLVHWQGRYTSWRVHDWAVAQLIPVEYVGEAGDRLTTAALEALAARCKTTVVFEKRGGKDMDRVLRTLRLQRKTAVEIDLFDLQRGIELTG